MRLELELEALGFYPRGGGVVHCRIEPTSTVQPIHYIHDAVPTTAVGLSLTAGVPESVQERMAQTLSRGLKKLGIESHILRETHAGGPGAVASIAFRNRTFPAQFTALGEKGKPAEQVAEQALREAKRFCERRATIGPHLADQIALPLAFATGPSVYRTTQVTEHLRTNLAVISQFVDRPIRLTEAEDGSGIVEIE
jgi:RNA 3'-terminal phosphate cyclase (ATP)